jgi:DNA repair exonuclease SbcCD ATPase subunit
MFLKKVAIKNFGRFKDREISFDDRMNMVFGLNESGKTTLNWFIRGMLYGLEGGKVRKGGLLPPSRRYEPWNGESYGGYLEYVLDNGDWYRIERDFSTGTTTVYDSSFNDVTHLFGMSRNKTVVVGDKHLGLDETGFEKTVFIDQLKTNPGEEGGAAIMDRLSNACLSGDEEISLEKARKALQDSLRDMVGTERTKAKPLNIVMANIDELENRKTKLLEEKEAVLSLERTLGEYRRKAEDIKCELDALEKAGEAAVIDSNAAELKQKQKKLLGMIEEADKLNCKINELSGIVSVLEDTLGETACFSECTAMDAATIQGDYRFFKGWREDLRNLEKQLANVLGKKEKLNKQLESTQYDFFRKPENVTNAVDISNRQKETEAEAERTLKSARRIRLVSWVLAAVALISVVLGIAGLFAAFLAAIPSGLGCLFLRKALKKKMAGLSEINKLKNMLSEIYGQAGVAGISELIQKAESFNNMLEETASLDTETDELKKRITDLTARVEDIKKSIVKRLERAGLEETGEEPAYEHVEAFVNGVETYLKTEKNLSDKKNELSGKKRELEFLLERMSPEEGRTFRDIAAARDYLSVLQGEIGKYEAERADLWNRIEKSYPAGIVERIAGIMQDSDNCVEALKREKNRFEEELRKLHLDIREYETRVESTDPSRELQEIEGDLEALVEKRLYMEELGAAIRSALEVIDEAADEIQNSYSPILNNKLGEIIADMTLERYSDLRADDDMRLNAHAPESGKIVSVSNLSGGTIDQMYLALRIAVSEIISNSGESLPLIFDEPFAQYDDRRMEKTIEYLLKIAEKRQVIISTCKERELEKLIEVTRKHPLSPKVNIINL